MRAFILNRNITSIQLDANLGPRALIQFDRYYRELPNYFCITDPDLIFNAAMPRTFIADLVELSERSRFGKVGLALGIDDPDNLIDQKILIGGVEHNIYEWELNLLRKRYFDDIIDDPIYEAIIDTTFAVYNKKYFSRWRFYRALRVAGRYAARHDPWFKDRLLTESEAELYANTQKYSTFLR
jgi:hypothetical protein